MQPDSQASRLTPATLGGRACPVCALAVVGQILGGCGKGAFLEYSAPHAPLPGAWGKREGSAAVLGFYRDLRNQASVIV